MRVDRKGVVVAAFLGLAALVVHGCAGDRLELPVFNDAGAATSDASCTQCGDECVDPKTDPRHCGTCANACAAGSACVAGACSLTCPTGLLNCAGTCLDPKTSAEHCGATGACDGATTGTKCATGQSCRQGVCASPSACPANTPDACGTGADALCTSFKSDPSHCGDCATVCDGGVCNNGTCAVACGPLQTTCGTGAAATCHTRTAPNDCCGTLCAADKDCTTTGCVACIPTTATLTAFPVAPDPALKVTCLDAAGNSTSTCPVVKCGGITFFAFSYFDNRTSLGVVGYDTNGAVIKPNVEKTGVRYITSITVNASTVTLFGQGGQSVDIPFTSFRLP